jgi:outer membrane lipoprotein-sorting protein
MKRRPWRYLFLGCFFLLGGTVAAATGGEEGRSPEDHGQVKARVFKAVAAQAETWTTLSSDFTQERHLQMLKKPVVSSGRFFFEKPDRLYWEVLKPKAMGFSVQGEKARRWTEDPQKAETLPTEKDPMIRSLTEQIFFWSRADFKALEKKYEIQVQDDTPATLNLIPLTNPENRFVSHLKITFSSDWRHVRSVEIHERGGDFTRLLFFNTRLNPSLPEGLWGK